MDKYLTEQKREEPTKYKTELCSNFIETGGCRYGNKCRYAHGHWELNLVGRSRKYKSRLCKYYHNYGFCSYGTRCNFIHKPCDKNVGRALSQDLGCVNLVFKGMYIFNVLRGCKNF